MTTTTLRPRRMVRTIQFLSASALVATALSGCAFSGLVPAPSSSTVAPTPTPTTTSAGAGAIAPDPVPTRKASPVSPAKHLTWAEGNTVTNPVALFTIDTEHDWKADDTHSTPTMQTYTSASTGCALMITTAPNTDSEIVPGDDRASSIKVLTEVLTKVRHPEAIQTTVDDHFGYLDSTGTADVLATRYKDPGAGTYSDRYIALRTFAQTKKTILTALQCGDNTQLEASIPLIRKTVTIGDAY